MPTLLSRDVSRVLIIDDEPEARKGAMWPLVDADYEPLPVDGPLDSDPAKYARETAEAPDVHAALCDQRLGVRAGYASYLGAELVRHWYDARFPAVLCTRYEDAAINDIRPLRRWIPVLLTPDDLRDDPDAFTRACQECIHEFDVGFTPSRKPWRAQVVVADVDDRGEHIWIEVPAWEHSDLLRWRTRDLPKAVREAVKPGFRLFAQINLGAERSEDLYFDRWDLPA